MWVLLPAEASAEYVAPLSMNYQIETCSPDGQPVDDGNGYLQNSNNYNSCPIATTTRPYVDVSNKKNADGYRWWVFSRYGVGTGQGMYLQNEQNEGYSIPPPRVWATTTTDNGYYPFDDASNLLREVFQGLPSITQFDYDNWRMYSFGSGTAYPGPYAYIVAYTNDNLYYINTRAELYAYLDTLYAPTPPTGTTTPPTLPVPKNIEILSPAYGDTTATTTYGVQIKYKTPFTLDFRPTTTRHFRIIDALTGEIQYQYNVLLEANSGENITITATTTTPAGSKYIRAMYLDEYGEIYSEVDEVFFNVATNTYLGATGRETPRDSTGTQTQIDCSLFDVGCQFQKAIQFLFTPDTDTLKRFSSLWQTIETKKPFGYVTMTINQLEQLDMTGAAAFSLGTVPFMDSIFTPFRTAIAGILWALFAIYFYTNRLRHIDI